MSSSLRTRFLRCSILTRCCSMKCRNTRSRRARRPLPSSRRPSKGLGPASSARLFPLPLCAVVFSSPASSFIVVTLLAPSCLLTLCECSANNAFFPASELHQAADLGGKLVWTGHCRDGVKKRVTLAGTLWCRLFGKLAKGTTFQGAQECRGRVARVKSEQPAAHLAEQAPPKYSQRALLACARCAARCKPRLYVSGTW